MYDKHFIEVHRHKVWKRGFGGLIVIEKHAEMLLREPGTQCFDHGNNDLLRIGAALGCPHLEGPECHLTGCIGVRFVLSLFLLFVHALVDKVMRRITALHMLYAIIFYMRKVLAVCFTI